MTSISQSLQTRAKSHVVGHVQALFNDRERGEKSVTRSDNALFPSDSTIALVHGDVTTMMIGGITALLLQMLHPAVLAGVWDHSNFRTDMLGRLRRTARFIAVTTYGERPDALSAIERVREIHGRLGGTLPHSDELYRADDPALLAWVHTTEAWSFLAAWQRFGSRRLLKADQDKYLAEFAEVGIALGAEPVPVTKAEADELLEAFRPKLVADARTREVARLVTGHPPANPLAIPLQRVTMQAAIDLLPNWARRMHRRSASPRILQPLADSSVLALAATLRWAFRSN